MLAGARPEPLDVQLQTAATNTRVFTFTRTDGSKLVAVWNDGPAVADHPGVLSTLTIRGFVGWHATGIDILNGYEQELASQSGAGELVISDFLLKDYPVIIKLSQ